MGWNYRIIGEGIDHKILLTHTSGLFKTKIKEIIICPTFNHYNTRIKNLDSLLHSLDKDIDSIILNFMYKYWDVRNYEDLCDCIYNDPDSFRLSWFEKSKDLINSILNEYLIIWHSDDLGFYPNLIKENIETELFIIYSKATNEFNLQYFPKIRALYLDQIKDKVSLIKERLNKYLFSKNVLVSFKRKNPNLYPSFITWIPSNPEKKLCFEKLKDIPDSIYLNWNQKEVELAYLTGSFNRQLYQMCNFSFIFLRQENEHYVFKNQCRLVNENK